MSFGRRVIPFLFILMLLVSLASPFLSGTAIAHEKADEDAISFPSSTHHLVDGSLVYLAHHPNEMGSLGATPAPPGHINVLIQLDSLDQTGHEYVEDIGGIVTDSWSRFNTMGAAVPLDSLPSLTYIPGLVWLEPSVRFFPMLASSVPAIGGDIIHSDYGLKGEGMTIAVLDTGINGNHEYLDDLDDDPETDDPKIIGFYDARSGSRGETDPVDTANHGSHCAGIAAGTGGTAAVDVGMAPQAHLVGVIVLDGGGGNANDIIDGINWVIENKDRFSVDVISMSLGGALTIPGATNDGNSAVSQAVDSAVDAGIVSAVAVGNGNAGVAAHAGSVTFPADSRRAITVGWVNDNGARVISSSRGPTGDGRIKPDVMAPGSNVDSAKGQAGDTGSQSSSGSSMSTPHVAGLAALMLQANPDLAPDVDHDYIKQIMHETSRHEWGNSPDPAEPYSPNNQYGWGTVDSVGAVQRALDLKTGGIIGPDTLPLADSYTYQYSINYTKTQYTFQGENGDSHNPPTGTTAPDVVYLKIQLSSTWPEPTDITANGRAYSGIDVTIDPNPLVVEEVGDDWVIQALINYTGDGDSGEYWTSYPLVSFTLTAPDEAADTQVIGEYSINSMPGEVSSLRIVSSGDSPDLTIASFKAENSRPNEGDIVTITSIIENIGDGNALDGTLAIYDGDPDASGVELTSIPFDDIESGKSTEVTFDWDTRGQIGDHSLYARITGVTPKDTGSNNNDALPIDIEVMEEGGGGENTPPEILMIEPDGKDDEADLEYLIRWTATDEDKDDTITIDLYYDTDTDPDNGRTEIASNLENSGEFEWDTSEMNEEEYHILGMASDGNDGTSSGYSPGVVRISHDVAENIPPVISWESPGNGSTVNDIIIISGEAEDEDGSGELEIIEIRLDEGGWSSATESGGEGTGWDKWEYSLDTNDLVEGWHTVFARAYDGEEYSLESWIEIYADNVEPADNVAPEIIYFNLDRSQYTVGETALVRFELLDENGAEDIVDLVLNIKLAGGGQENVIRTIDKASMGVTPSGSDRVKVSFQLDLSGLDPGSYTAVLEVSDTDRHTVTGTMAFELTGSDGKEDEDSDILGSNEMLIGIVGTVAAVMILGAVISMKRSDDRDNDDWNSWGSERHFNSEERDGTGGNNIQGNTTGPQGSHGTCPSCGGTTEYSKEYSDHYCWLCEAYVGDSE